VTFHKESEANHKKKETGMILRDRVALVTGASRGIGAATAELLASRGAFVVATARTIPDIEAVARKIGDNGGKALALPCDLMNPDQVDRMVNRVSAECGRIDVLVNNAGQGTPSMPVENITPEDWDHAVALNLRSSFLCVRAVAPLMKAQRYGYIVNVSSFAGRNYSPYRGAAYAAAKAGLLGFTRQMAAELGPYGICVNAVAPYLVLTQRARAMWESFTEEKQKAILSGIPLRRLAEVKEIASAIAFLSSDEASFISGVCLDVNGGSYMA
jgi:NAD(P)-dependent dehydrogenase (short-subunit alcohol dehydrogenase family)